MPCHCRGTYRERVSAGHLGCACTHIIRHIRSCTGLVMQVGEFISGFRSTSARTRLDCGLLTLVGADTNSVEQNKEKIFEEDSDWNPHVVTLHHTTDLFWRLCV